MSRTIKATVKTNGKEGVVRVTVKLLNGEVAGYLPIKGDGSETTVCEAKLDKAITGVQDVYFTFSGEGYEIIDWIFE